LEIHCHGIYLSNRSVALAIAVLCGSPELKKSGFDVIIDEINERTPTQLRHPFGFNLGTFHPCYGVTQMVTHEMILF
jgi:hypothetical protein